MDKKIAIQEALVSNFAALLGCKAAGSGSTSSGITTVNGISSSASAEDFLECLSDAVLDSDVVVTLPSMEMKAEATSTKDALPQVGETHQKLDAKPEMKASVLDNAAEASASASKLEQVAAQSLGTLTSWTKSTLVFAPQAASKSISTSFSSLLDSRVRAWTLLLLRHSLTTGDSASRNRLLSMLSSTIEIRSSETSFKTLALPESARMQPKDADVILPLLFEAILQISVQGKSDTIPLRAPGTIAGHFAKNENASKPGLMKVEVRLDPGALLESMVEQARLVVFKAVARATSVDVDSKKAQKKTYGTTDAPPRTLSSFSSALNLSADQASQNPRLLKARSSALRLNNILQGKSQESSSTSAPLNKIRKTRSVQWEQPLDTPSRSATQEGPSAKRQRVVQSQFRLRSMKSFGRPHAESGREVKNATFGDFGRPVQTWGRDGKLLNHPVPGGGLTNNPISSLNTGVTSSGGNQNATFDFGKPQKRTISARLSASLSFSRPQTKSAGLRGLPSTLPRTATALESWLVNNATKSKR